MNNYIHFYTVTHKVILNRKSLFKVVTRIIIITNKKEAENSASFLFIYYYAFLVFFLLNKYQTVPAIHTDEYPPAIIPAINGRMI